METGAEDPDAGAAIRPDGGGSPLDRVLEALSDPRERYVLYELVEREPVDVEVLAERVAAWELGDPGAAVPDDRAEQLHVSLYHHQLPKLSDLGIVEYDRRSGVVRCRDPPPFLEEFVRLAREVEQRD